MITAPRTADPSTATLTRGKPCCARGAAERRGRYCAVSTASATQKIPVSPASSHATRARTSVTRPRQQGHDPGAEIRGRPGGERAADRLAAVPHARQTGARGRRPDVVAAAVVRAHALE